MNLCEWASQGPSLILHEGLCEGLGLGFKKAPGIDAWPVLLQRSRSHWPALSDLEARANLDKLSHPMARPDEFPYEASL